MSEAAAWNHLLDSARRRRSRDAPYFKPACLIAAVDLVNEGVLDPADINPERLVERVDALVRGVHHGRADMRWQPVWHLSNDGAWVFTKAGRRIGPEHFEPARKPVSLREWRGSFDKIAVPLNMLVHWRSAEMRGVLRRAALSMLAGGNDDCRALALTLSALLSPLSARPEPGSESGAANGDRLNGQGFQTSTEAKRAVEARAMAVARAWLERDGWTVADHSATESYDLSAKRGAEMLYIEVKGSTGDGDTVHLTHREVEFAHAHRDAMALAVVARISLADDAGTLCATGGELRVLHPWSPPDGSLRPIAYMCRLEVEV